MLSQYGSLRLFFSLICGDFAPFFPKKNHLYSVAWNFFFCFLVAMVRNFTKDSPKNNNNNNFNFNFNF